MKSQGFSAAFAHEFHNLASLMQDKLNSKSLKFDEAHLVEQICAGLAEGVVRLAPSGDDAQLPLEGLREVRGEADGRDLGREVDGSVNLQ